jgi:hypothetical protein
MERQRPGFEHCARAEKAAAVQRRSGMALATTWSQETRLRGSSTRRSSQSPSEAGETASTGFSTRAEASQGVFGEGIERFLWYSCCRSVAEVGGEASCRGCLRRSRGWRRPHRVARIGAFLNVTEGR